MRKLFITLFVIIPLLTFGQAKKLYRKAIRTTDLNEKIILLTEVIKLSPKHLDAYFHRAIAKNDLGDYSGAIVDYSKIIVEAPDADTYYNRGNSRYSIKDFVGAKEDYAKAFQLDENFIDALYSLGFVKYDLEEYESAIKDFSKVIKMEPYQPKTYTLRASAYKALKNHTKALENYTAAIIIEPSADSYYNRGVFFMEIKYYKKANIDLKKSIRINKNNAYAYFYRGASHLFLGKFNDAILDFNAALKFDAMDFDAYLGLAITYHKINDTANAKLNFKKANSILSLNKDITSIQQYSNTYWFQNQYFYFNKSINELVKMK